MFRWAVTEEQVPASVPTALREVGGLRRGRDPRLRDSEKVKPVPEEHFWPVVKAAHPQIATMLQVQRLTGMRPDGASSRGCEPNGRPRRACVGREERVSAGATREEFREHDTKSPMMAMRPLIMRFLITG